MIDVQQTDEFSSWLHALRDQRAKTKIASRVRQMAFGNMGQVAPVGSGLSEMKIDTGPGYRVYFVQTVRGEIVVLLCGGDKDSQSRDITRAKEIAADLDRDSK